jgi:hypothetical protein
MVLIFWIIVPGIFLGFTILLFQYSTSNLAKIAAILMATLPWIALVGIRGNMWYENYRQREETNGRAIFKDERQRKLTQAIANNSPEIERIARADVPLNVPGRDGMTLLHFIFSLYTVQSDKDRVRIGKILLDAGADPNLADSYGKTPAFYTNPDTIDLLGAMLDKGADSNRKDKEGRPLLFEMSSPEGVRMLIDRGANLNITDSADRTALFEFASRDSWAIVLMLLEAGADWRIVPPGQTPFAERVGNGDGYEPDHPRRRVVEWLKQHPAPKK